MLRRHCYAGGEYLAAARDYQYHSGGQKINSRANCNCRMLIPLRVLVIVSKPFALKVVLGSPKLGWFKSLKAGGTHFGITPAEANKRGTSF